MENIKKIALNGVEVYPFSSFGQIIDFIDAKKGILVAINAEKILHATPATRALINRNIGYCDGMGAMKALRQHGCADAVKLPGCELWLNIVERFHKEKSFYLLGSKQEVVEATVRKLKKDYPGVQVAGYHDGYLTTSSMRQQVIDEIVALKPDVVFVAMGSPKQELLMEELQKRHQAIYQGLGGSFDVYTGHVQRAPRWWVDHNLEFAYRLIKEPKRLRRQVHLVKFEWWLLTGKFKGNADEPF